MDGLVPLPTGAATLAEVVALVSALADLPVGPSLVVAGTVDALGDVGPAGALPDRLRALHDLLTRTDGAGVHGAVVPAVEVGTLMLPAALAADAAAGRFDVHAVARVEEALELLLGTSIEDIDRRVLERLEGATPAGV